MNIEKAKRQLRVMLSGPASGYMECATAVKAILDELEAAEKRIAEQREYYEGVIADGSKRIAELERSETQLINERDSAESALNDAYKAVMGQAPEWSNWFSFENAIDEIELVCELWRNQTDDVIQFRQLIAEQSAIVAAAEKLVRCKGRYHSELNYRALAKLFGVVTPDLPPLEHENVHYADAAEVEITTLRQRIAELESNEVREVGNQFLVVRHPGKTPAIKHCTGDLEEFLRKLIEQDPLVTIDIITHRYYGVGGQWVQDAGEYLQMMQGAGIGVKGE